MKRLTGSRFADALVVIAILVIPLMYGGLLTSAYHDPTNSLDTMTAAVINEDTPADVTLANGDVEHFALGDELTDRLTHPEDGQDVGFTWVTMTHDEAEKAIKDEKIRAILEIPAGFTADVTKVATSDQADAVRQHLSLRTDDGVNYLAGTLARSVAISLEQELTARGVERYVDNVVMSLGTVRDGMVEAADGAADAQSGSATLAKGLTTLADGTRSARDGAHSLAGGLATLADGTRSTRDGAHGLADGLARLSGATQPFIAGISRLDDGAATLRDGVTAYTSGVSSAADGARELASGSDGLTTLVASVHDYTSSVESLRTSVVIGSSTRPPLTDALAALSAGAGSATDKGNPLDPASNTTLVKGVDALSQGIHALDAQVKDPAAASGTQALVTGSANLASSLRTQQAALARARTVCANPGATAQCLAIISGLADSSTELVAGADTIQSGVSTIAGKIGQIGRATGALATSSDKLTASSRTLADGLAQARASVGTSSDLADPARPERATLAGALNTLSAASPLLREGTQDAATRLGAGAHRLSDGLAVLGTKNVALNAGARSLADGAGQLADGAGQFADGITQLDDGSSALASGLDRLADGAGSARSGATTLTVGLRQLADGADDAQSGSAALADGLTTLADGLASGADRIPAYTQADADHISDVIATPVEVAGVRDNAVANNGAGFTPMFMSLSLWIGGIAMFLVLPALDRRSGPLEKWWKAALRPAATATLLALGQAVLLMVGTNLVGGLHAANLPGLVALAVAASLTFVAVNQACVAVFAYRGRFVSIVLLCLQITSMGATFPIETTPRFFQWIHPFLPMSYTQLAFRDMIAGAGATDAVVRCLAMLATWFVVAVVCVLVAARVRQGAKPLPRDNALLGDSIAEAARADAEVARVRRGLAPAGAADAPAGSAESGAGASV